MLFYDIDEPTSIDEQIKTKEQELKDNKDKLLLKSQFFENRVKNNNTKLNSVNYNFTKLLEIQNDKKRLIEELEKGESENLKVSEEIKPLLLKNEPLTNTETNKIKIYNHKQNRYKIRKNKKLIEINQLDIEEKEQKKILSDTLGLENDRMKQLERDIISDVTPLNPLDNSKELFPSEPKHDSSSESKHDSSSEPKHDLKEVTPLNPLDNSKELFPSESKHDSSSESKHDSSSESKHDSSSEPKHDLKEVTPLNPLDNSKELFPSEPKLGVASRLREIINDPNYVGKTYTSNNNSNTYRIKYKFGGKTKNKGKFKKIKHKTKKLYKRTKKLYKRKHSK